jgi:hypothetical protein
MTQMMFGFDARSALAALRPMISTTSFDMIKTVGQWNRLTGFQKKRPRSEASGAFKYTAVGLSKSTVSLFLMLVRLESSPRI